MRIETDMLGERSLSAPNAFWGFGQMKTAAKSCWSTLQRLSIIVPLLSAMTPQKKNIIRNPNKFLWIQVWSHDYTCIITAINCKSSVSEALAILCLPPFLHMQTSPVFTVQDSPLSL